ncbi:MAG: hypothetical protein KZQ88_17945, partial [Candidatus Thiodiazotropha sp. (ex Dulcina madagascariensis)]|nr:hypothetical protein [Candidatus Thiodiazotropha sp. (ex Dulcina madagascariensis)]
AVGRLQRRFDALLQAGTLRLKVHYLVAGLIIKLVSVRKEKLSQRRQDRKVITYCFFIVFIFPWRSLRLCERNCLVSGRTQVDK